MGIEIELVDVNNLSMILFKERRLSEQTLSGHQEFIRGYKDIEDVKKRIDKIIKGNDSEIKLLKRRGKYYVQSHQDAYDEVYEKLCNYIDSKR